MARIERKLYSGAQIEKLIAGANTTNERAVDDEHNEDAKTQLRELVQAFRDYKIVDQQSLSYAEIIRFLNQKLELVKAIKLLTLNILCNESEKDYMIERQKNNLDFAITNLSGLLLEIDISDFIRSEKDIAKVRDALRDQFYGQEYNEDENVGDAMNRIQDKERGANPKDLPKLAILGPRNMLPPIKDKALDNLLEVSASLIDQSKRSIDTEEQIGESDESKSGRRVIAIVFVILEKALMDYNDPEVEKRDAGTRLEYLDNKLKLAKFIIQNHPDREKAQEIYNEDFLGDNTERNSLKESEGKPAAQVGQLRRTSKKLDILKNGQQSTL